MKSFYFISLIIYFLCSSSCVSTLVEASPHDTNVVNLECHKKSSWSYWWGLDKTKRIDLHPETEGVECPCRHKAMAWVEVNTSVSDFMISLITLGIVNHRTVIYGCAKSSEGEQEF